LNDKNEDPDYHTYKFKEQAKIIYATMNYKINYWDDLYSRICKQPNCDTRYVIDTDAMDSSESGKFTR